MVGTREQFHVGGGEAEALLSPHPPHVPQPRAGAQHPPEGMPSSPQPCQGMFGTWRGVFLTILQQGIYLGLWLGDLLCGRPSSRNFTRKSLESRKSLRPCGELCPTSASWHRRLRTAGLRGLGGGQGQPGTWTRNGGSRLPVSKTPELASWPLERG